MIVKHENETDGEENENEYSYARHDATGKLVEKVKIDFEQENNETEYSVKTMSGEDKKHYKFKFEEKGGKPYNLLHLNALYDLMTHTYTDAVIQKSFDWNEHSAFVEMTKHHSDDTAPAIFIADRGYESYNKILSNHFHSKTIL